MDANSYVCNTCIHALQHIAKLYGYHLYIAMQCIYMFTYIHCIHTFHRFSTLDEKSSGWQYLSLGDNSSSNFFLSSPRRELNSIFMPFLPILTVNGTPQFLIASINSFSIGPSNICSIYKCVHVYKTFA